MFIRVMAINARGGSEYTDVINATVTATPGIMLRPAVDSIVVHVRTKKTNKIYYVLIFP